MYNNSACRKQSPNEYHYQTKVQTDDDGYSPHIKYIQNIHLNLRFYSYENSLKGIFSLV